MATSMIAAVNAPLPRIRFAHPTRDVTYLASLPKASAQILAFVDPFLSALPQPRRLESVRNILNLASVAWNLPVYEDHEPEKGREFLAEIAPLLARVPAEARGIFEFLLRERRERFYDDPRLVVIEVRPGSVEHTVLATSFLPGPDGERFADRSAAGVESDRGARGDHRERGHVHGGVQRRG